MLPKSRIRASPWTISPRMTTSLKQGRRLKWVNKRLLLVRYLHLLLLTFYADWWRCGNRFELGQCGGAAIAWECSRCSFEKTRQTRLCQSCSTRSFTIYVDSKTGGHSACCGQEGGENDHIRRYFCPLFPAAPMNRGCIVEGQLQGSPIAVLLRYTRSGNWFWCRYKVPTHTTVLWVANAVRWDNSACMFLGTQEYSWSGMGPERPIGASQSKLWVGQSQARTQIGEIALAKGINVSREHHLPLEPRSCLCCCHRPSQVAEGDCPLSNQYFHNPEIFGITYHLVDLHWRRALRFR